MSEPAVEDPQETALREQIATAQAQLDALIAAREEREAAAPPPEGYAGAPAVGPDDWESNPSEDTEPE